jgi:PPK2 family polyphosphate:nucleotide phosphotransferase
MPSNARPGDLAAFAARLRVAPVGPVNLAEIDPDGTPGFTGDRDAATAELEALRGELEEFQERLFAEKRQALLIVLQAVDAGGKDGVIRNVFTAFNPQGARVTSFGVPTEEELAHDFLWRVHAQVPGRGRVGIFNRSHYEDVLVVRVEELVPAEEWQARYEQINHFEALVVASGTTVLKFMLHISRSEQRERLQERLDDPRKRWKFRHGDLEARARWDDYQSAYADALARCSTADAPWYVIPANRNWYRNLAVARIVVEAARRMDPHVPEPEEDLSGIVVPD